MESYVKNQVKFLLLFICFAIMILSSGLLIGCSGKKDANDMVNISKDGNVWYVEGFAPTQETFGNLGDMFLDSSTYNIYRKDDMGWEFVGNIKGSDGQKGDKGNTGWKGENGDEIQLDVTDSNIIWRYENSSSWNVLISLEALKGNTGDSAREIELQSNGSEIQWRYVAKAGEADFGWNNLVSIDALTMIGGDGKSAYEVATKNGFEGSEVEWLASLKGQRGAIWHIENTAPINGYDATVGDLYLDTSNYKIYQLTASGWADLGSIKGTSPIIEINDAGYWVINGQATEVVADQTKGEVVGDILAYNYLETAYFSGKKITIVGDSITNGVGATNKNTTSYTALLQSRLGVVVENLGLNGTTLCDGVIGSDKTSVTSRISDVKNYSKQTDYFIIQLGVNDWIRSVDARIYMGALGSDNTNTIYGALNVYAKTLSKKFAGTNTKVIFLTPIICKSVVGTYDPNVNNKLGYSMRDICNAIIETANLYDINVLDLNIESGIYYTSESSNNVSQYMKDIVHPNDAGHEKIADAIINYLQNNLTYVKRTSVKSVTLNFYSPENGGIKYQSNFVVEGGKFKVPNCPKQKSDSIFKYWTDSLQNIYLPGDIITVDERTTLNANYVDEKVELAVNHIVAGEELETEDLSLDYSGEINRENNKLITKDLSSIKFNMSYGLVPTFYKDKDLTEKLELTTVYFEGDTPTVYVYWETDVSWFVVENGVITGKTENFPVNYDQSNAVEKLVFPRYSSDGSLITSINSGAFFLNQEYSTGTGSSKTIGSRVFTQTTDIYFPEGYSSIQGAFFLTARGSVNTTGYTPLTITIPSTLTSITEQAFGNLNVKEFVISDSNTAYSDASGTGSNSNLKGMWLNKEETKLYRYVDRYVESVAQTSYDLPDSITTWGQFVFYGNKTLKSLTISANLTSVIGSNTLAFMSNLTSLTIEGEVESKISTLKNSIGQMETFIQNGSIYVKDVEDQTYLKGLLEADQSGIYENLLEKVFVLE